MHADVLGQRAAVCEGFAAALMHTRERLFAIVFASVCDQVLTA
jgi:hypothetical protein